MYDSITQVKRPKPGYEPILVGSGETWTSGRFIDQFLATYRYAVTPANRELVRVALRRYPGPRPIVANDLTHFLLDHFQRGRR
ncbi:MAG: hypothetical protein ABIS17_04430 [Casimicrobiaceae bacterium]